MKVQYDLEGEVYGQSRRLGWIYKVALAGLCIIVLLAGSVLGSILFQSYYEQREFIEIVVEDVQISEHSTERDHGYSERTTGDDLHTTTPLIINSEEEHYSDAFRITWDSDGLTVDTNRDEASVHWGLLLSVMLLENLQDRSKTGENHGELNFMASEDGPENGSDVLARSTTTELYPSSESSENDAWIPQLRFIADENKFSVRFQHSDNNSSESSEHSKSEEHQLQYRFRCEDGLLRPLEDFSEEGESLDLIRFFTGQKCKWNEYDTKKVLPSGSYESTQSRDNENQSEHISMIYPGNSERDMATSESDDYYSSLSE